MLLPPACFILPESPDSRTSPVRTLHAAFYHRIGGWSNNFGRNTLSTVRGSLDLGAMSDTKLPAGKLPLALLDQLLTRFVPNDPRIIRRAARWGEDAAVFDFGDHYLVAKTDPITFATSEIGWYAVNVDENGGPAHWAPPRVSFWRRRRCPDRPTAAMAETIFSQIDRAWRRARREPCRRAPKSQCRVLPAICGTTSVRWRVASPNAARSRVMRCCLSNLCPLRDR